MNNDELYKVNKEKITFEYKGYKIEKIIAADLLAAIIQSPKITIKTFISFFRSYKIEKIAPSSVFFSMGEYGGRKDYQEILKYVRSQCPDNVYLDFSKQISKFRLSLSNIYRSIIAVSKLQNISLSNCLVLATKLTFYLNVIDELEKRTFKTKKYCAFSSCHPIEAILTLYFQKRNIETYALQHGLYFVIKKRFLIDQISYKNFISDYHFCWGEYTYEQFRNSGIEENRLLVGGYPRNVQIRKLNSDIVRSKCVLLMARRSFDTVNIKMLKLLVQTSFFKKVDFSLKLHPSLNWDDYSKIAKKNELKIIPNNVTLSELFNSSKYNWGIAVNTAAYYEAYLNGIPCLRFNDGSFDEPSSVLNDDIFTVEGFENKYIEFMQMKADTINDVVLEKLNHLLGYGINNYDLLNQ